MWIVASAIAAPLLRQGVPALPSDLPFVEAELRLAANELTGQATLTWVNRGTTPVAELPLLLHANDGAVPRTRLTSFEVVEGGPASTVASEETMLVQFERPLAPGARAVMKVAWTARLDVLPPDANDLFAQGLSQFGSLTSGGGGDFGLLATGEGLSVVASAIPVVAPFVDGAPAPRVLRRDRPIGDLAWNVPTRWDVTLVLPEGVKAVTNLAETVAADGSVHCQGAGPQDFVFVAGADLVTVATTVNGVTVRSTTLAKDAAIGAKVLDEGARALRALERYGRYPYTELDLVEASLINGAGGVEFGSLALIAAYLYRDPRQSTHPLGVLATQLGGAQLDQLLDLNEQRGFVVAHEVAHQWAPGLAVSDAWSAPIVDEPLAQYLAWRVVSEGQDAAAASATADRLVHAGYTTMRAMGTDDGPAARATTGFSTQLEYGGLVYGKAPGLYFALERAVGREALDGALKKTFAARAWQTTGADGWLAALEQHGATGATALGARWWTEAHGDEDLAYDPAASPLSTLLGPQSDQVNQLLQQLGGVDQEELMKLLGGFGK